MDVKLVLLMNYAALIYCQKTTSCINEAEWQNGFFEDIRYEIESIRQLINAQQKADVCNERREIIQEMKSEIQDIRQILSDQTHVLETIRDKWHETGICPPGFTYLRLAKSCYKVVYESHDWFSAGKRCQEVRNGSHLVAITSATENSALKAFLATEVSKNAGNSVCLQRGITQWGNMFWTSGQPRIRSSCRSPYVWKISSDKELAFDFTSWTPGEPNCDNTKESCMDIQAKKNFGWNDESCLEKICPLCEYTPEHL